MNKKSRTIMGILFSALVIALFGGMFSVPAEASSANHKNKAIYIVPHQDDETLTYGPSIVRHIKAGREVHVVLVTDGSASGAFKKINNRLKKEGRKPITKAEFTKARDKEFIAASKALGVKPANIHIYKNRAVDGTLTPKKAEPIIDDLLATYPGASFKTMSWLDNHRDHYSLGYALNNRCVRNKTIDCRFYHSTVYAIGYNHPNSTPATKVPSPKRGKEVWNGKELNNAAKQYNIWNPDKGRYAVGYTSVKRSFDYSLKNRTSIYHKNNSNWVNGSDLKKAKAWQTKRGYVS